VSDKVGCGPDLVRDSYSGYVVDSDDADSLASRLATLVCDEDRRLMMGAAGREIVESWNYRNEAAGVLRATEIAVGSERWANARATPPERSQRHGW
jgi:glycosyltransferase involved in cell wall biosynthesis